MMASPKKSIPSRAETAKQPAGSSSSSPTGFLPLARKYRPRTFAELIGQPHVTTTLGRAIETKRIGQAYLFTGQRGVGKTSAARIFATSLNCANGPTPTPCQTCSSCVAITRGTSLDVIEIDGASNRGIDDIRQLREQVKLAPMQGPFRIYIIDEVHQITPDAFNALLKTLEEPPPHVRFVFATTAPQKVPATILSRCQRFDFRRLDAKTIVAALERIAKAERLTITEPALYAIARAADGSLRDAEVMLEQLASFCEGPIEEAAVTHLIGAVEQDTMLAWVQAILEHDVATTLTTLHQQLVRGKDLTQLVTGLLWHLRNLVVLRAAGRAASAPLLDVPSDQLPQLETQAQQATPDEFLLMIQIVIGAYEWVRRTPFAQAVFELVLVKLATRESWTSLEQIAQRLERLTHEPPAPRLAVPSPAPIAQAAVSSEGSRQSVPVSRASIAPRHTAASLSGEVSETTAVSLAEVSNQWSVILERVGQRKISLAAYLMEARPLALAGAALEIGLPGFALHQEVLNSTEHLRVVEEVIADIAGCRLSVRYTTLPEPPPGTQPAPSTAGVTVMPMRSDSPPIMQDIVQLFNATIIPPKPSAT